MIDESKAETAIQSDLEKHTPIKVKSVTCPSGQDVKPGATFACTVTDERGKQYTYTLKILNDNADVKPVGFKRK